MQKKFSFKIPENIGRKSKVKWKFGPPLEVVHVDHWDRRDRIGSFHFDKSFVTLLLFSRFDLCRELGKGIANDKIVSKLIPLVYDQLVWNNESALFLCENVF